MFSVFKDKLQSVQDNLGLGLTTSFRGLKVSDPTSPKSKVKIPVDLNAGADLLQKYHTDWQEMHKLAEENASAAKRIDGRIGKLHTEVTKQMQAVTQLSSGLASVPKMVANTEEIISQIEGLQQLTVKVEETLVQLADLVEQKQLWDRQQRSKQQLRAHSDERLVQLDALRAVLSENHREKVQQYEKEFEKKQKERQETFGKAFEDDLNAYKQTGVVPTIRPALASGPSLEEVELDFDTDALDHMLEEE